MNIELNVYKGKDVVKTYSAEEVHITVGTVEELLKVIDIDDLIGLSDSRLGVEILKLAVKNFSKFKTVIKDVFPEMTDEEYSSLRVEDLARAIFRILTYTLGTFASIEGDKKK